jgi:hypothetical protein
MKPARVILIALSQRLGAVACLLAFSLSAAFGHDNTEVTTKVYLRTNCLEVRVTLAAPTAKLLLEADGHSDANLSSPAEVIEARPLLAACAAQLFRISSGGKDLALTVTNVAPSVEDHIEVKLIYPRPAAGTLRFEAVHLTKLPTDQPYGALVTVVDLANNVFLSQQLLTARDHSLEVKVPALPANSTAPKSLLQPKPKL